MFNFACPVKLLFNRGARPWPIPMDSGIGFAEGEPVRARGMNAPSQRENFNHRNTFSISRIALKLHFVQNVEPDTGIG